MTFLPVTILAIDPGSEVSGYALFREGTLLESGIATTCFDRELTVRALLRQPGPHVVVAETWRPMKSHETTLGMGAAWGLWRAELEHAVSFDLRRVFRVDPETWRKACYGVARLPRPRLPKNASAKEKREASERARADLKQKAIDFVAVAYRVEASADEAEAICIGAWGSEQRAEIERVLGARAMKQLGCRS
jgi:hypothetical protein